MPVGLKQFGGCVLEGKVYLVGGGTARATTRIIFARAF
jgi:hypothetical protein